MSWPLPCFRCAWSHELASVVPQSDHSFSVHARPQFLRLLTGVHREIGVSRSRHDERMRLTNREQRIASFKAPDVEAVTTNVDETSRRLRVSSREKRLFLSSYPHLIYKLRRVKVKTWRRWRRNFFKFWWNDGWKESCSVRVRWQTVSVLAPFQCTTLIERRKSKYVYN